MPKSTDGPFLWHEGLRSTRETFSIHRIAEPRPAPYLLLVSGTCSLTPVDKRDGEAKWWHRGDQEFPSPQQQDHNSLGKLSRRELGGGYKQQITDLGSNLQQNTCISTPIMQPPSNAFSGWGFYNQELEVAEDFRWQENSHRGSCAGRWGLELFLNVNSINLH